TGEYLNKLYSSKINLITGKECSVSGLSEKISSVKSPSFLHIGAHGNFYSGKPMESSIYLSDSEELKSGVWTAQKIATSNLSNIPLVTLSSCETGLSDISKQRDVFGFHRALFFAGTKSIISPLWSVHD
ncbi:MAG: CHAT domain-containing protein, partial [Nitrosopumilaceae archaeon]|nr:CHAT domain-containing protein [Nitrosopumilaceae archaeon]